MKKAKKQLVSVCIPSLNTLGFLKDCIAALKKSTKIPLEILVLDLGDDGTYEWCVKNKIKVFKQSTPFYFAQSNNYLAQKASGDTILFLNSDTIPQKDFLEHMLEEMEKESADIVGALLYYPNFIVQHAGVKWKGEYPNPHNLPEHIAYEKQLDEPKVHESYDVQAVTGACMLIKKHTFFNLGGFDTQFKNCYEDIDLCLKAKMSNVRIRYCGKAKVVHYVSGTKGTSGDKRTSGEFMEESKKKLFDKYWNPPKKDKDGKAPEQLDKEGYMSTIIKNTAPWQHRLMIGTPTTGMVRMEWVFGRYGQVIPTNWSQVDTVEWMSSYAPLEYLVPDAQNLIVKSALEKGFEWLLLFEQDNVPLSDAFIRLNEYLLAGDIPIVSGVYFTKSVPPEPILYRGRGVSYYDDWKMGDKVWVDGIPTGFTLIHCNILKAMWDESPEYLVGGTMTRRVFDCPRKAEFDPVTGAMVTSSGTSDLEFCTRVMKEGFFKKGGFPEYQEKEFPFLVDTNLFLWHIDNNGRKFPLGGVPERYMPKELKK